MLGPGSVNAVVHHARIRLEGAAEDGCMICSADLLNSGTHRVMDGGFVNSKRRRTLIADLTLVEYIFINGRECFAAGFFDHESRLGSTT